MNPSNSPEPPLAGVAVLVDVSNLYYTARDRYRAKLDYGTLLGKLTRGRRLVQAIAYCANWEGQADAFEYRLRQMGYCVRSKVPKVLPDGRLKADWDAMIGFDAAALSAEADKIILCTGDGDFHPVAEELGRQGKEVEVVSFRENTATELRTAASRFTPIQRDWLVRPGQR